MARAGERRAGFQPLADTVQVTTMSERRKCHRGNCRGALAGPSPFFLVLRSSAGHPRRAHLHGNFTPSFATRWWV